MLNNLTSRCNLIIYLILILRGGLGGGRTEMMALRWGILEMGDWHGGTDTELLSSSWWHCTEMIL